MKPKQLDDPCFCGHDLTDHLPVEASCCDIHGCRCDGFEADGPGYDPEAAAS